MRPVSKLQSLLQIRIEFLQQLFLIGSYRQLLQIDAIELKCKHYQMIRSQTDTVTHILHTIRIDDYFKKQFHRIVLRIFNKIQPGINLHKEPNGTFKQMISDYIKFFKEMKQKYILNFLGQIVNFQVYNQTTIIYVLLELIFKYLRIKCINYIEDKIEIKKELEEKIKQYTRESSVDGSYFLMRGEKNRKNRFRNVYTPLNKQSRGSSVGCRREGKNLEIVPVKCQTICHISGEFGEKCEMKEKRNLSEKPKRKMVKCYKEFKQQVKQRIQKKFWQQNRMNQTYPNSFPYHTKFMISHREEWKQYLQLIGINDIAGLQFLQVNIGITGTKRTMMRKKQWQNKNNDRVIIEGCSRNDSIRRQIQIYNECYYERYKMKI